MKYQFTLRPFKAGADTENFSITGVISRHGRVLSISYFLQGPLEEIILPVVEKKACRLGNLWEETCLEFFLQPVDSPEYWEFNLAPSRHWNVYHFDDYRKGMAHEERLQALPFEVRSSGRTFEVHLDLDLGALLSGLPPLKMAISAVVKPRSGAISHWALTHPAREADFHHPNSFILAL